MKQEFSDNIKKVKELLRDDLIMDRVQAACWISLLQTAAALESGIFYNNLFFMLIPYDDAMTNHLASQSLFPNKIFDAGVPSPNGGYVYVVCYDFIDYIGYPIYAIKSPYFKFKDMSEKNKEAGLKHLVELYEIETAMDDDEGLEII